MKIRKFNDIFLRLREKLIRSNSFWLFKTHRFRIILNICVDYILSKVYTHILIFAQKITMHQILKTHSK